MRAHGRSDPCAENAGTHCTRGTGKAGRRQAKRGEGGRLLAIGAVSSSARAAARVEARLPFGLGKNDPGRARSTTQAMFPYLLLRAARDPINFIFIRGSYSRTVWGGLKRTTVTDYDNESSLSCQPR